MEGTGLFSGRPARVVFRPAASGSGIRFSREDVPGVRDVPATVERVSGLPQHTMIPAPISGRNTSLAASADAPAGIATIEHAMSALAGLGVTDAVVEVDGPELPIGDGSAWLFVEALERAGRVEQAEEIEPVVLRAMIEVRDKAGGSIRAMPRDEPGASYAYHLDYGSGAVIPRQSALWDTRNGGYATDVAPARTFSLEAEARAMRALGLFGSFTPRDLVVVGGDGRPIENAWRFADEAARHKVLDLVGDVALLGRPVRADIVATRSGHALTHELVRMIRRAWAEEEGEH